MIDFAHNLYTNAFPCIVAIAIGAGGQAGSLQARGVHMATPEAVGPAWAEDFLQGGAMEGVDVRRVYMFGGQTIAPNTIDPGYENAPRAYVMFDEIVEYTYTNIEEPGPRFFHVVYPSGNGPNNQGTSGRVRNVPVQNVQSAIWNVEPNN